MLLNIPNMPRARFFSLSFLLQIVFHSTFLSGLGYDKSNDRVRTPKVNAIFSAIYSLSGEIESIKKGEPIPVNQFSGLVTSTGFKPVTLRAEI